MKCDKKDVYKSILFGVLSAVFVFFVGFGVMSIMYQYWYRTSSYMYPTLKGLYDYKASALGDSICLPIMIGAGITYVMFFHEKINTKKSKLVSILLGIVGGFLGLIMQAQWIISDSTILNWSIPEQHHFNCAGWYHAFFFIGMCFAVFYIFTCIIQIDISLFVKDGNNSLDNVTDYYFYNICQFLVWSSGLLFMQFHFLDDFSDKFPQWQIICFVSLFGLIILFVIKFLLTKKINLRYYAHIVFSVLVSMIIAFIVIESAPKCDLIFLISSVLCTSLYIYNSENKAKMLGLGLLFGFFEYLCQVKISKSCIDGNIVLFFLLIFLCLLALFLISLFDYLIFEKNHSYDPHQNLFKNSHITSVLLATVINLGLVVLANYDAMSKILYEFVKFPEIKYEIGAAIITLGVSVYVKITFEKIKKMEYDDAYSSKQVEYAKLSQYIIYFFMYFSASMLLYYSLKFDFKFATKNINFVLLIFAIILVISCCLIIKIFEKKTNLFLCIAYFSIAIYLILTIDNNISRLFTGMLLWITLTYIIFMVFAVFHIMKESMLYNVALLRQIELSRKIKVSSIIVAVGCSVCYGLAIYHLLIYQTLFHVVQTFCVIISAFVLIPYIQASVLNPGGNIGILDNYARSGVMQDGFLFGIVAIVNSIFTMSVINNVEQQNYFSAGTVFWSYFGIVALFDYCLKNNNEHSEKKHKQFSQQNSKDEKLDEQDKNLRKYLRKQNIFGLIISFPYSIFILLRNYFVPSESKNIGSNDEKP